MGREIISIWKNEIIILLYKNKPIGYYDNVSAIEDYCERFVLLDKEGLGIAFNRTEYDYQIKSLIHF